MKKINILYVFWIIALILFIWLMLNLKTQVTKTIFGTATTQVYSMNVEYATIVNECKVHQGDRVKKGDTLLVLLRGEMDKSISDVFSMINQLDVDRNAKNQILDKEEAIFNAQQASKISAINAQITILEKEIEIQNNLLYAIGQEKTKPTNNIKQLELAGLKESLEQLRIQSIEQKKSYNTQREGNNKSYEARLATNKNDIDYYQLEKHKMIVVAPCDGIVDNVYVLPKDMAPQYKELIRINSVTPNRVTGFIHESMAIPFQLGDSVLLTSAARQEISCKGMIIGNGNHLVELPLRLRKFVELRAWGREIFVQMNPDNNFYIDEKILIQIN